MNSEGSHWSIEALKEYMDRRFQTMTDAVALANTTLNSRLEGMNEFREQILGERTTFVSKEEYEARHALVESRLDAETDKVVERVNGLERWQAKLLGAMGLVLILLPVLTALTIYYITRPHAVIAPATVTITVPAVR